MKETMIETEVNYPFEQGGRFYIIEHVPGRVCREHLDGIRKQRAPGLTAARGSVGTWRV